MSDHVIKLAGAGWVCSNEHCNEYGWGNPPEECPKTPQRLLEKAVDEAWERGRY